MLNKLIGSTFIVVSLFSSCVGTKKLNKAFTKDKSSVVYLFDTQINSLEKIETVIVVNPVISDSNFTNQGELVKTKANVLPLIIYTGWDNEHLYFIGKNVIKEDLSSFIKEAVIEETNRSTSMIADSTSNSNLFLEITVENIGAHGPYSSEGFFLFLGFMYFFHSNQYSGEGTAYSNLSYVLKRNEEVLLTGNSHKKLSIDPNIKKFKSYKEIRKFHTFSLVEGLSRTLKANIEEIAKEVENYIVLQQ